MKVLVNCYACSPYQGSEPGMGWNFVKCISHMHELHIIAESKFQPDLERYFSEHIEEKSYYRFYFIKKTRHKRLRKIWPPSYYWFYKIWQKKAYKLAVKLDKEENFDLIHQLNMVGYREPGYLWKINKPFVWGPIGGFGITPWVMLPSMGINGILYYGSRNLVNLLQMHLSQRVKSAMKRANVVIAATAETQKAVRKLYSIDSVLIPEVGYEADPGNDLIIRKDGERLRVCWSGQHTKGKALNLLIESLAVLNRDDVELHVIGGGSETSRWEELAYELGVKHIVWHGWVNKKEAHQIMKNCHLLCITSLKDLTSTVLLEGLSFGLPVIALDHCGFSNVIDESCGIKISICNKKQVVYDLSRAISELAESEETRMILSKNAKLHASDFNWEQKAIVINSLYLKCRE